MFIPPLFCPKKYCKKNYLEYERRPLILGTRDEPVEVRGDFIWGSGDGCFAYSAVSLININALLCLIPEDISANSFSPRWKECTPVSA